MKKLSNQQLDELVEGGAAYMQQAFDLARRVISASPNPRVGCVLVREGRVVGSGWHEAAGQPHAEVRAMESAQGELAGATAFVTLEPCSHHGRTGPCADALIRAGIHRVVIAAIDPSPQVGGEGVARLEEAGIEVIRLPGFKQQAERLNPGWLSRHRRNRPYVRCKLAMSLDGRIAMADGASKWITSAAARSDAQMLRAASDAIVTGVQTVLTDDPQMNVRSDEADPGAKQLIDERLSSADQPLRVIADSRLRTPSAARIIYPDGEVKIFTTRSAGSSGEYPENVEVVPVAEREGRVHLQSMLESLSSSFGCNEILVEAGPTLSSAFLEAGLIDELIIYIAPKLLGSDAMSLLTLSGLQSLDDAVKLEFSDFVKVGDDIRVTAIPQLQD